MLILILTKVYIQMGFDYSQMISKGFGLIVKDGKYDPCVTVSCGCLTFYAGIIYFICIFCKTYYISGTVWYSKYTCQSLPSLV